MNTPRGQIPDSFIQEVMARTDIVDIVGRHVTLRKGGANLLGLCPFHGEKSPSFTVSPSKQFYHCFGCGAHGDAIGFLMAHAGLGFVDALRDLAQQAGIKWPEVELTAQEQAQQEAAHAQRRSLHQVLDHAAEHYRSRLKASARAIDYLKRRGLSGAVARDFGLGYAPDGWRSLASAFADYADPALVESGLVIVQGDEGPDQRRYDRFRDRIMFPIRSVKGEIIGFGGRVIDSGEPKYLNSPETPLFSKGHELYGLFEGRTAIRARGHALVVEGYMDVVALAQSGIGNAVATLGTACTPDHVRKLLRFTDHIVFSFDGDAAGRRAAGRALAAALPHASDLRSFRFLFLPAEHDPDSFVREHGAAAFEQAIGQAVPMSRQLLELASQEADLETAEGRARMLAQARPLWASMPECALRTQILADLARAARLGAEQLAQDWGAAPRRATASPDVRRPSGSRAASAPRRGQVAIRSPQDHAVRMLMLQSGLWHQLSAADHELLAGLPGWHGEIVRWLERELMEHGDSEWPQLRAQLADTDPARAARELVDHADIHEPPSAEALQVLIDRVRQLPDRQRNQDILAAMRQRR